MTLEERKRHFIERANEIHHGKYDYSKVEYINDKAKVCIICPEHGEFWQDPHTHLKGSGCPKCISSGIKKTIEFIERAKKIHGDKYDYSKVCYIGSNKKVCIICPEHGEFWQYAYVHLKGSGCPRCDKSKKLSKEEFIEKSNKIHHNKYDYSKVEYVNNKTKVCIICPEHGEFWQSPRHHLVGLGCSLCTESSLEREIRILLEEENISYIKGCDYRIFPWLKKQHLDFYLPDYGVAIECQGIQHFKPINIFGGEDGFNKCKKRDLKKKKLCEENNITLLYYSNIGFVYPYNVFENKDKLINVIKNG